MSEEKTNKTFLEKRIHSMARDKVATQIKAAKKKIEDDPILCRLVLSNEGHETYLKSISQWITEAWDSITNINKVAEDLTKEYEQDYVKELLTKFDTLSELFNQTLEIANEQ